MSMTIPQIDASESMIERMGRAIAGAFGEPDAVLNHEYAECLSAARAVLTALREPTPGMIDCGEYVFEGRRFPVPLAFDGPASVAIWQAMLSEAAADHIVTEREG